MPGDILPSENEFSRFYQISPMTVRQAMSELVNEGYIHRERGRGTFVSTRRMSHQLERLMSFSEDMKTRNVVPGSKILRFEETKPPEMLIEQDKLQSDDCMLRIQRLRLADGQPVGLHDSYLRDVSFSRKELEASESLYTLMAAKGIQLHEGVKTIEAVAAPADIAELLDVEVGSPLLQTTQISWDQSGELVEYVVAHYHPDLYQYTIQLRR